MDKQELLNDFAKHLVVHVRDKSIEDARSLLEPHAKGPTAARVRSAMPSDEARIALQSIIPEIIDIAIFWLLDSIDDNAIHLSYRSESGYAIDLSDDGKSELAGRYLMQGGWRERFSTNAISE